MKIIKFLTIFLILALAAYLFWMVQKGPYGRGGTVFFPKGYSVSQIGRDLKNEGIIRNVWSFKLLVRLRGVGKSLQAGEYEFPPKVTLNQVIEKIRKGERVVHRLTIPEGYTFSQVAELLEKAGIATADEVDSAFKDPRYLSRLGFPATSLEGYLFPATYEYDRGTSLEQILDRMIQSFLENFDPDLRKRAQLGGWTIPQVVTLASIIEKETGSDAERGRIASVFHNRLQIGMPLQSDPTVIYGIPNFDGNIRKKDLLNPHPYNTYTHVGLPPGPIASPGKESLKAVLYPEQTNYLFFVSKGDGTHYFSETLEGHNEAVRKYQMK